MIEFTKPEAITAFLTAEPVPEEDRHNPPYIADSIDVLTNWFLTCEYLFPKQNADRAEEVLGFRCVWEFPNGWTLTTSEDAALTIAHRTDKISADNTTVLDALRGDFDITTWGYAAAINGWQRTSMLAIEEEDDFLPRVLATLTDTWGMPSVLLPWQNYVDMVADDLDTIEEFIDEAPEEARDALRSTVLLMQSAHNKNLQARLPWIANIWWGDDGLPQWSSAGRIWAMASELDDAGNWIVSLDEHCGSCFSGEVTAFKKRYPDVTEYCTFVTWGQSSYGEWEQDGRTSVEIHVGTEQEGKALLPYLVKYGFITDEDLEDMEDNSGGRLPEWQTLSIWD